MSETTPRRQIVAQFLKLPSCHLELRSVTTIEKTEGRGDARGYDVDFSKSAGCYIFQMTSCGCAWPVIVDGIYYASRGAEIKEEPNRLIDLEARRRNETRRIARVPAKFRCDDGGDLLDWLERNAIQDDAVWCSECQDDLPGNDLCEHCWWCDKTAWYSTPDERCGCGSREECSGDA